ncbi:hypothetical protein E1B28_002341 [Marasmius oreades]|uniref:Uncharacterized protein n=1 Tax=Marasmius oreades TaxID=181124 RepID=A0A9P7RMG3_9AGAR|nr:uncharacterized protein E1B28_002341 [Marasmius oreades]KAG7086384.1 hypothetical protein E1B28_002341 [Marasmius oreades]
MPSSQYSHARASSSTSSTFSKGTNSLAITSLPKEFFQPHLLLHLYTHFQTYGKINQWVPLPGFGRILVVYENEDDAEKAKIYSDPIVLNATEDRQELVLRVYRADPNPLISDVNTENQFLQPPGSEQQFLTSPGGERMKEILPNPTSVTDELIAALKNLYLQQNHNRKSGVEVLMDAAESGVSVVVEDCDFGVDENRDTWEEDSNWMYGVMTPLRTMWRPFCAAIPPFTSSMSVPVY